MNIKKALYIFVLLGMLFSVNAYSASTPGYVDPDALSTEAFEKCKYRVMNAGSEDFRNFDPNRIVEACHSFPLSDDVFVQILGALIGKEFVALLDVYTGLTGEPHGFDENESLFVVAMPMHETFYAFNYLMLGIILFGILVSVVFQVVKWAKGDFKVSIENWSSTKLVNYVIVVLITTPVIGWMTILQALALMVIILLGYIAKLSVTYLFLAVFFSNVASEINKELELNAKSDFGSTIFLYQCDLSRREDVLSSIQNHLGTKNIDVLATNPVYRCLTNGGTSAHKRFDLPNSNLEYAVLGVTPAVLAQTQSCLDTYKEDLVKIGYNQSDTCGYAQFKVPRNSAYPTSMDNAISLYMSSEITNEQRRLAIKFHEYNCRTGDIKGEDGGIISECLIPRIAGSAYTYEYLEDEITEEKNLVNYSTKLTSESLKIFLGSLKASLASLQSSVISDPVKLMNHLKDLISPFDGEEDLPQGTRDKLERIREEMSHRISGPESSLGFSEKDAEYLVNNIKRGAWTSSSLFFDGLTDDLNDEIVVSSMKDTYAIRTGSWINDILSEGVEKLTDFSAPNVASLLSLNEMNSITSESSVDTIVPGDDTVLSGLVIPRLGVYTDNLGCWFEQSECVTPSLNPFRELGQRGTTLMDQALVRMLGIKFLAKVIDIFVDIPVLNEKKTGYQKFMVLETLNELVFIYFLLGLILAIIIPAIPFLKLMVMMINWGLDIIRELLALQVKVTVSVFGNHGKDTLSQDIKESLSRIVGLGFYFLFILIGLMVMFLMFSFLYSINIFFVGALSSVVSWGGDATVVEAMVINVVMDVIVTFVLIYEVVKCSPYIEKIPKSMAEHFGVKVSNSDAVVDQIYQFLKQRVPVFFADSFIRH